MNWNGLDLPDNPYYSDDAVVIYCADCREILPLLPDRGIDLVLTDPPYGLGENNQRNKSRIRPTTDWGNPRAIDYSDFDWDNCPIPFDLLRIALDKGKYQMVFGGNYYPLPPTKCWLVWDKETTGDFADCELVWTNLNQAIRRISYLWSGYKKAKPEKRYHPTQKPLEVVKWCITQAKEPINLILDPFLGSGTTCLAAKLLNLQSIGIEIEEKYCEIAAKRCSQTVMRLEV